MLRRSALGGVRAQLSAPTTLRSAARVATASRRKQQLSTLLRRGDRDPAVKSLLAEFPAKIDIDIQWGEMDAFGHVNNIVYLRYVECSRIEYFRALGDAIPAMDKLAVKPDLRAFLGAKAVGPILRDASIR